MNKIVEDRFYLHAISKNFNELNKEDLELLQKILQSGYLYSRRKLHVSYEKVGFNGVDYISLCDYLARNDPPFEGNDFYKGYTSYNAFIMDSLSLMIKEGRYKIIKPILTYPHFFSYEDVQEMDYMGRGKERYSDLPDEVQVKDKINLINLIGISLPITHNIEKNKLDIESAYQYLCWLEKILKEENRKIGVYDLEIQEEINSNNFVKIYKKQDR